MNARPTPPKASTTPELVTRARALEEQARQLLGVTADDCCAAAGGRYSSRRGQYLVGLEKLAQAHPEAAGLLRGAQALYWEVALANQRLGRRVASQHRLGEDGASESLLALHRAAQSFEPERGLQFSTYAGQWLRAYLGRAAHAQGVVHQPAYSREQAQQVRRQVDAWEAVGRSWTMAELAKVTGHTVEQLRDMVAIPRGVSINKPLSPDDDITLGDILPNGDPLADEVAELREVEGWLEGLAARAGLDDRELEVVRRRFGLGGGEPESLAAIGRDIGLSRERVRQVEGVAMAMLMRVNERGPRPTVRPPPTLGATTSPTTTATAPAASPSAPAPEAPSAPPAAPTSTTTTTATAGGESPTTAGHPTPSPAQEDPMAGPLSRAPQPPPPDPGFHRAPPRPTMEAELLQGNGPAATPTPPASEHGVVGCSWCGQEVALVSSGGRLRFAQHNYDGGPCKLSGLFFDVWQSSKLSKGLRPPPLKHDPKDFSKAECPACGLTKLVSAQRSETTPDMDPHVVGGRWCPGAWLGDPPPPPKVADQARAAELVAQLVAEAEKGTLPPRMLLRLGALAELLR